MATVNQQLEELRAQVGELRRAVVLRDALLDTLEDSAYQRGRESILGSREASKPTRTRPSHLRAVSGSAS